MTRAAKALWTLAAAGLGVMVASVLYFTLATIRVRVPYWGEAEVLFEASRLRDGLPLFVDPLVGAAERGAPPSRWYVTYPPLWAAALSIVPAGAAQLVARASSTFAWFGALAWAALSARRESRPTALACAAYVGGIWVLANFATTGRPDALACALAAVGLARATRLGRIDGLALVLLVLAPWVKPTVLGLPLGALAGDLALRRRKALPAIGAAVALSGAIGLALHLASGGALFSHVVLSNAQPFTWEAWLDHVPSRLPFFAPLFALAGAAAFRDRSIAIGGAALAGSVIWALVALAKTGSASNYWMEPCVAAAVVVARAAPTSFSFGRSSASHAVLALAAVIWAGAASVRGSIDHAAEYREDARFVATLPERCRGVVAADEAGIELAVDGRVLVPTYQMAWLARAGRYPAEPWIADLRAASCVVEHTGQLRLVPPIARALDQGFTLRHEERGYRVLVPSPSADAHIDPPADRQ